MRELDKIKNGLKRARRPGVRDFRLELDTDSTGDPAVLIYVIVEDAAVRDAGFRQWAREMGEAVVHAVRATGVNRWPYVRFRTVSEERELADTPHQ